MSLVMDPPLNLQKSLSAARKRVSSAAATAGGGKKGRAASMSRKQQQQCKSPSPPSGKAAATPVQELAFHVATAAAGGVLVWALGMAGAVASGVFAVVLGVALAVESSGITNPLWKAVLFIRSTQGQEARRAINVDQWIEGYNDLHNDDKAATATATATNEGGVERRNESYATLVNAYYELATLFYEVGWGTSFHFATRRRSETFGESIKRHEYFLASKLRVPDGSTDLAGRRILDVGCGVGGPYRNIAKFTGADVTGITLNEYQVQRGNRLSADAGLLPRCRSVQGDFMKLPFHDESFDGAYAIEATCHAPNRHGVYSEIYRVLKPGATLAMYEWCLTPEYDASSALHRRVKKQIEEGDGLPDMARTTEIDDAAAAVGFEILESRDVALDALPGDTPWYTPLQPSWNIFSQRFQFTGVGKWLTTKGLRLLEFLRLAPAGTCKVQTMLLTGGEGCYRGGELGIFTPMYMCVVRKPLDAGATSPTATSSDSDSQH